ncbi:hypothetical protein MtrunA17_Chr4g0020341 [Medicago truncatula]|uniref:Uncharacterized protein n=1 Tax=Medicago truncatula TaxID=3880 RepID=I3T0Z6_MEDTR|nr:unknown [Medicago truncatula]RHN60002.1 hypothetical protein MtrunA17_Chr4g0020341 [Medicago truncatula]
MVPLKVILQLKRRVFLPIHFKGKLTSFHVFGKQIKETNPNNDFWFSEANTEVLESLDIYRFPGQMTQNQAIIEPEARPKTKNNTLTIPAVSACCNFTVLGAKIINTLVRYPFVSPKRQVSIVTGISVRKNFGPCRHPKKRGKNNSLAMQQPIAIFAFSRRYTAVRLLPTRSKTLKQVIRRTGYQSLRS